MADSRVEESRFTRRADLIAASGLAPPPGTRTHFRWAWVSMTFRLFLKAGPRSAHPIHVLSPQGLSSPSHGSGVCLTHWGRCSRMGLSVALGVSMGLQGSTGS